MRSTFTKTSTAFLSLTLVALLPGFMAGCTGPTSHEVAGQLNPVNGDFLFQTKNIGTFKLGGSKKIALTYDDGPTKEVTDALLNLLRKEGVKATFFMLGQAINSNKATVERMRDDGHVLANHSYSHESLADRVYRNDLSALLHEVQDSHSKIKPYMNPSHRYYFRAPFGAWTASHAAQLNRIPDVKNYIGPIFWNIGGELQPKGRPQTAAKIQTAADWDCWTNTSKVKGIPVEVCAAGYMKEIEAREGGVVLMHDKNMKTVEMSAILIPKLKALGYEFVTLEDLSVLDQYE